MGWLQRVLFRFLSSLRRRRHASPGTAAAGTGDDYFGSLEDLFDVFVPEEVFFFDGRVGLDGQAGWVNPVYRVAGFLKGGYPVIDFACGIFVRPFLPPLAILLRVNGGKRAGESEMAALAELILGLALKDQAPFEEALQLLSKAFLVCL